MKTCTPPENPWTSTPEGGFPCPPLTLAADGAALRCAKCRRSYPITPEGIPQLVIEAATIEPPAQ